MPLKDRLSKNLAATWISHVIVLVIGLFVMPFVLRTLGDGRYGVWIFINSIAGYSGLLYLGMGEMIARFVARHHARDEFDELNESVTIVFGIYVAMGLVCLMIAGGLAACAPWLVETEHASLAELRWVILILGLNIAIGLAGSVFGGVLIGVQRYDIFRWFLVAAGLVRLVCTFGFLTADWGLLTLSLITLAVTLTENLGPIAFAYRHVPTLSVSPRNWKWERFRECFSFSSFMFLENVAHQLIYATDSIVIGIILGAEAIVPYFIASRLCEFIKKPIHQIGFVSMPQAGALHAKGENDRLRELVFRSAGLAFVLASGFVIGSAFFGASVIETWVGAGYERSYALLLILLTIQVVALPTDVLRSVLLGMGFIKLPCVLYLVEALCNLGLTLLLIGPYDLTGVAIGTAIPLVLIELGVVVPYALRKMELPPWAFFKRVCLRFAIPLGMVWAYASAVSDRFPDANGWPALAAIACGGGGALWLGWIFQTQVLEVLFHDDPPSDPSSALMPIPSHADQDVAQETAL